MISDKRENKYSTLIRIPASGVSKSMGIAFISFADLFDRENPDILIVLGDR